jgi:hypothetical protein
LIDLKASGYQNQRFHLAELGRDPMIMREPGSFTPREQRAWNSWLDHQGRYRDVIFVHLKREFWNSGLQMVLQMREIDLIPEKPEFEEDDWHEKGQRNEICATAHYIYSAQNISPYTPPTLPFRRRISAKRRVLPEAISRDIHPLKKYTVPKTAIQVSSTWPTSA